MLRQVSAGHRKTHVCVSKTTLHCLNSCVTSLMWGFRLMAIQQCELVLVHIFPQGEDTLVSDRLKKEVSEKLEGLNIHTHTHLTASGQSCSFSPFLSLPLSDLTSAHQ